MDNAEVMYLHCEVYVCAKDSNSSRCSEGCAKGGSRRRRDELNQAQQKGVTSLGPLKILLDRMFDQQGPDEGRRSGRFCSQCIDHFRQNENNRRLTKISEADTKTSEHFRSLHQVF